MGAAGELLPPRRSHPGGGGPGGAAGRWERGATRTESPEAERTGQEGFRELRGGRTGKASGEESWRRNEMKKKEREIPLPWPFLPSPIES